MADHADYYAVLGVERDAAISSIKAAYRRLASAHHPDRNPTDGEATTRFQSLVQAYDVLGDSARRAAYDAGRPVEVMQVEPGAPLAEVFGRVLDQLFGVVDRVSVRGDDTRYRLELSFAEAELGCSRVLSLPRERPCAACDGRGFDLSELPKFCGRCASLGTLERRPELRSERVPCPDCQGRGFLVERPCEACGGTCVTEEREDLTIQIPPRSQDGQRLLVRGAGGAGRGSGQAGDCYVELHVQPHPQLQVRGKDLWLKRPIPLPKALAGGWLEVPALSGVERIQLPPGSRDGDVLRMRGHGLSRESGKRGDLFVELTIEMPADLTAAQLDELTEALEGGDTTFPKSRSFEQSIEEGSSS
ncbi:MAG: hypothetical protein CL940_08445 [Deltaproteobacteria bacterium]|nr:hypothetical protein [Deltaproteobacteria bacterium]